MTPTLKADDGRLFDTAAECAAYENREPYRRLAGLPLVQIADAIERRPEGIALADAIEAVARDIVKKRLADGERRRKAKAAPLMIGHEREAAE